MGDRYRKYSREFKIETVKMVTQGGHKVSEVARDLGIHENLIYKWRKQFSEDGNGSFPGKGRLKPGDEEVHFLRREPSKARQERDILRVPVRVKKALAYFAEEDRRGSVLYVQDVWPPPRNL